MGIPEFESIKEVDEGFKIYFTSYLRQDFVEKSVVISLKKDFTITNIYLNSYDHGSLEWINGFGLSGSRKWETDEQAQSPGYLTRRYTSRISDGYAPEGHTENLLIPDVLDDINNKEIVKLLKSVLKMKKTRKKIVPQKYGLA